MKRWNLAGARNRGKRSGRASTRIPTVTPRDPRVFQFAQSLPLPSPVLSCLHLRRSRWPVIDPLANFQMLRRYGHDVTRRRRTEDEGARERARLALPLEDTRYPASPTGECISQTSDLHQIDPLSQQDQLYARGVFLSSPVRYHESPAVSARAAARR